MLRQEEIFNILKNEWRPNEIPSGRFKEAMNELLKRVEEEKLNSPKEIIFETFNKFESDIVNLIHKSKDELHLTVES